MIQITHDETKTNNTSNENSEDSEKNDYISEQDLQDLRLLETQAAALIILIYGYILEYVSTIQGIEVIKLKYTDNDSENEPDPDVPALLGAQYQLFAQMILVQVSAAQYRSYQEHYKNQDLNAARSATFEIYAADVIELVAYIVNLIGVKELFKVNHEGPAYDV